MTGMTVEKGELTKGKKVRVIDWKANGNKRPDAWNSYGEMDEWCGRIVTITSNDIGIILENDNNRWMWSATDFEPASDLPVDNPNVIFMRKKRGIAHKGVKSHDKRRRGKTLSGPG